MTAPAPDFDFPDEPDDDCNLITTERVFSRRTAPSRTRLPASLPRTGGSSLPSLMPPGPTAFSNGFADRRINSCHERRLRLEVAAKSAKAASAWPSRGLLRTPVPGALTP